MSRYIKLVDQNPKLNYTQKFVKFWNRALKGELFVGLWLVLKELLKAQIHTVQYPLEKLP